MNTLTTTPVSTVLHQLFSDAEASNATLRQTMGALPCAERDALMASARAMDFRPFYERAKQFHLAVSRQTGALLYMLARSMKARSIIEFGTSFGVSTLHLAAALRDNGGGQLISTEFEPSKVLQARGNVDRAGLSDLVEIREGDAMQTLSSALPDQIDLVLLDGAKALYPSVLALLEPRLRTGAIIVADNADWSEAYLAMVRTGGNYLSVPFADDVELSMKLDAAASPLSSARGY